MTKSTVEELRQELVNNGYTLEEAAAIKGKFSLLDAVNGLTTMSNVNPQIHDQNKTNDKLVSSLNSATVPVPPDENIFEPDENIFDFDDKEITENTKEESTDNIKPEINRTSPEWTAHVLRQLTDDEKFNDRPTVDGLRRLVEIFVGRIIDNHVEVCQNPTKDNGYSCVVNIEVTVDSNDSAQLIRQAGVGHADINNNTQDPFNKYSVTIAETRAEGRIFKKLLGLKKITAAEEFNAQPDLGIIDTETTINSTQIATVDIICKRLDINVVVFIKSYLKVKLINDLTYEQAISIVKRLSEYQQEIKNIPEKILKYDSSWKVNFYAVQDI